MNCVPMWSLHSVHSPQSTSTVILNHIPGGPPSLHILHGGKTLEHHHIFVVAHGYGGLAFVDLLCYQLEEVQHRVKAVAFLDSSHNLWHQPLGKAGRDWLKSHSRTWILSTKPLNRSVGSLKAGSPQISAGTRCHDSVPTICMESVFRFFSKTIKPKATPTPFEIITRSKSRAKDQNNNLI
uniref:Si:ch73-41e3.7 n=1 Tax=Cyprinus carpio TaxID=7962 RepID=A0A8C1WN67_CYPCA